MEWSFETCNLNHDVHIHTAELSTLHHISEIIPDIIVCCFTALCYWGHDYCLDRWTSTLTLNRRCPISQPWNHECADCSTSSTHRSYQWTQFWVLQRKPDYIPTIHLVLLSSLYSQGRGARVTGSKALPQEICLWNKKRLHGLDNVRMQRAGKNKSGGEIMTVMNVKLKASTTILENTKLGLL